MCIDADDNLYVADFQNIVVRKVTPQAVVSTYAGAAGMRGANDGFRTDARFNSPDWVALSPIGDLYVADWLNGSVRKIDGTGSVSTFASGLGYIEVVSTDTQGDVYASVPPASGKNLFVKFDSAGQKLWSLENAPGFQDGPASAAQFQHFGQPAFLPDGNILMADVTRIRLIEFQPGGACADCPSVAGLTARWSFNESSGLVAHDSLGHYDGTLYSGARFVPGGVTGNALELNRDSGSYVKMGDVLGFEGQNFTVAAWIKMAPGDQRDRALVVAKHEAYADNGYFLSANPANSILGAPGKAMFYAGDAYDVPVSQSSVNDGQWHFLAGVHESPGNNSLFIDGTLESAVASKPVTVSPAPFLIGGASYSGAPQGLFNGDVDEVQIFARALTSAEIRLLFNTYSATSNPAGSAAIVSTLAAIAGFNQPNGGFVGPDQASYIADAGNHQIRRVDIASGSVSLVAGTGVPGFADGTASLAQFNTPLSTFADKFGTVFVADTGNNRVRKISVDNPRHVATYAGSGMRGYLDGPADKAQFDFPTDLVIDSKGNIFISEFNNHTIRKLANSVVSTFAGQGAPGVREGFGTQAGLNQPAGLAIDANDNLYVTEWGSHRVRKVTPAGYVTTLAGSTSPGFLDGISSGARFFQPDGIVFAPAGALYATEHGNHSLRKILLDGTVSTVAGRGVPGYLDGPAAAALFNAPGGIGIDGSGNLVVADTGNNRVRRIVFTSVPVTVQRSLPAYYWPGQAVTVTLDCQPNPTADGLAYALEERVPSGWNVASLSLDGSYDALNQKIKFGPYFDLMSRTLTYTVVAPAGTVSVNGTELPIGGNASLTLAPLHPADLAPADQRITANELTSYGAAWRNGQSWALPPNPIPLDYVTRAGLLWKNGEQYTFSPVMSGPPLWWVPLSSTSVPGPTVRLLTLDEGNSAIRVLPSGVQPGQSATARIRIQADAAVSAYAIEETIPTPFAVSNVGSGGEFDPGARAIRWGPFLDSAPRELTYDITLTASGGAPLLFQGVVSFDGSRRVIGGQQAIDLLVRFEGWTRANNGDLIVTLNSINGRLYRMETSTDLETWTDLSVVQNLDGKVQIQDPANSPCKFYRLVSVDE